MNETMHASAALAGATLSELFVMLTSLEDAERRFAQENPGAVDADILHRQREVRTEMRRRYPTYRTRSPAVAVRPESIRL